MFFGEFEKRFGQATDSTPNIPSSEASLDVGNDGKGRGGEFRVTAVVGGKSLKKLLKVGVGIKMAGSGGEGLEGTHGGKETKKGEQGGI